MYKKNFEPPSLFSSRVLQVGTDHSKNVLIFFYEMKSRSSLTKECVRQKTKIDNALKAKPYQNQNIKPISECDSSNNLNFTIMKTQTKIKI